jgi:hypothetical protein
MRPIAGSSICRVCGLGRSTPLLRCACCAIEFGAQDLADSWVKDWRSKWLTHIGRERSVSDHRPGFEGPSGYTIPLLHQSHEATWTGIATRSSS